MKNFRLLAASFNKLNKRRKMIVLLVGLLLAIFLIDCIL